MLIDTEELKAIAKKVSEQNQFKTDSISMNIQLVEDFAKMENYKGPSSPMIYGDLEINPMEKPGKIWIKEIYGLEGGEFDAPALEDHINKAVREFYNKYF